MELKTFTLGLLLIFSRHSQILNAAQALSESMLSHSVLLKFLNVNLNQWRTEGKDLKMQKIIANLTTDYCQADSEECGLSSNASPRFKAEDVKTVTDLYPKNKDTDLETLIYVEIPNGSDKIPGTTLQTIIRNGSARITSYVGYSLGSTMSGQTLADSDEAKVNNKLNKIMIPVAFFLLLAIALICWVLHRGRKKQQSREERQRYAALHNSKKAASLREKGGAMVNTADHVSPAQAERGPAPDMQLPENGAQVEANNNMRRHKKKRTPSKKQPIREASGDESDDVFDDDPDELEKPKRKGRRRKGRRSYDLNQDYEKQAAKELASSQVSSEGTNVDLRVNGGYQQDSEKGESDPRNSNADSAVELSSSVASSANQSRGRTLPPIPKTGEQEIV